MSDTLFPLLSLSCGLLMLHVMQQTLHDPSSQNDSPILQTVRRFAFIMVICGLAWNVLYHYGNETPVTPAEYLIVAGIGLMFLVRAVILFQHRKDHLPARNRVHQR